MHNGLLNQMTYGPYLNGAVPTTENERERFVLNHGEPIFRRCKCLYCFSVVNIVVGFLDFKCSHSTAFL